MAQPLLRTAAPLLAGLLALGACDKRSGYPSLAPRPAERSDATPPAAPPASVAIAADTVRDARAAALAAQAAQADAAFVKAAGGVCRTIAAGLLASEGSEAWVSAQQALSALDAARGPVRAAAAELDKLLIDSSGGESAAIDTDRLAAADAQVSALDAAEQARVTEISAGGACG